MPLPRPMPTTPPHPEARPLQEAHDPTQLKKHYSTNNTARCFRLAWACGKSVNLRTNSPVSGFTTSKSSFGIQPRQATNTSFTL